MWSTTNKHNQTHKGGRGYMRWKERSKEKEINGGKTSPSVGHFMEIKWLLSFVCYMPTAHYELLNFKDLSQHEPLMAIKSFDSLWRYATIMKSFAYFCIHKSECRIMSHWFAKRKTLAGNGLILVIKGRNKIFRALKKDSNTLKEAMKRKEKSKAEKLWFSLRHIARKFVLNVNQAKKIALSNQRKTAIQLLSVWKVWIVWQDKKWCAVVLFAV